MLKVEDLMTKEVLTVDQYEKVEIALDEMEKNEVRHQVVTREGVPESIVSLQDLLSVVYLSLSCGNASIGPVLVRQVCAKNPIILSPETPITEAIPLILEKKLSAFPVIKEGELKGILSTSDLLKYLQTQLLKEEKDNS